MACDDDDCCIFCIWWTYATKHASKGIISSDASANAVASSAESISVDFTNHNNSHSTDMTCSKGLVA